MSALLHDLVTRAAATRPASPAIVMGDAAMSYRELETMSDRLAQLLVKLGVVPGDRICLAQRKSPGAIVSMLGALKAGAMYVPMDVHAPPRRLGMVSEAVRPRVVLADGSAQELLPVMWPEAIVGSLDGLSEASFGLDDVLAQACARPTVPDRSDADVAHILFTSGSTGTPKGVMVTHAAVRTFIEWASTHLGHRPDDRMSCHAPLFFDLSTFDIYGALTVGATVHLLPPGPMAPLQVVDFIASGGITQWLSVPSVLGYLADAGALHDGCLPSLRRVMSCGDVLRPQVLRHWMERVPHARYFNLYGPTETTIASTCHEIRELPDEQAPLPIGVACAGEAVFVLDDEGRLRADGEIGEICISGAGLSPGYWEDANRTDAAFVHVEALGRRVYRTGDLGRMVQGVLHFSGRRDGQVKTRGYRVELGDVESGLATIQDLADCVVVGIPAPGFAGTAICCAWIARAPGVSSAAIRRQAATVLPSYMVPSRWLEVRAFPKTANGKHDRRAIARLFGR